MKKIIKDACILFAITLVAGVLLGIVYDVTKAPIANQSEKAKQEAYRAVLPDAVGPAMQMMFFMGRDLSCA